MLNIYPLPAEDLDALIDIVANAYPGLKLNPPDEKRKMHERLLKSMSEEPTIQLVGAYRDGKLVGGMRLFDFRFKLLSTKASAGGVGMVAVDLLHKKEHVAKELILYFLRHYRQQGTPMAMLYPFRPDFYRQMGFGFVTRLNQYRLPPGKLPRGGSKAHVRYATPADAEQLLACYARYADRTNGMIERALLFFNQILGNPEHKIVVYERDQQIGGYLLGMFKPVLPDNMLLNDLLISEMIYEDSTALSELLTFLHSQADQINALVINTQDEYFHHLVTDPRNGSNVNIQLHHETNTQNVGLMYHVIDVPGVFAALADHDFGGQSCRLKLTIDDSFLPENAGSTTIAFEQGRALVQDDDAHDVALRLDVADFSSLLIGAISFKRLYEYGRVTLSDARHVALIQRLFAVEDKPICMTRF